MVEDVSRRGISKCKVKIKTHEWKRNTWLELERKDNRREGSRKRSEMKERIVADYTKKDLQTIYRNWLLERE